MVKKSRNYIIGLDPSLTGFGIAIFENIQLDVWDYKRFYEIKSKVKGDERLYEIECKLRSIYKKYPPLFVCKEAYAYARANQAHQLGELGYAVKRQLYKDSIPYVEIAPPTLKKFITGSGRGDKNLILREVYRKWDFIAESDNVADAYGLGKFGAIIYNRIHDVDVDLNKYEEECVKAVLTSKKKGINYGRKETKKKSVKLKRKR